MAVNVPAKIAGSERDGLYSTPGMTSSAAVSYDDKYVIIGTVSMGISTDPDPATGNPGPIARLTLQAVTIEDHPKFITGGDNVAVLYGPQQDLVGVELGQPASTVLVRPEGRFPATLWPYRLQFQGGVWQLGVIAVSLTPSSGGGGGSVTAVLSATVTPSTAMDFAHGFTDQPLSPASSDGSPAYTRPVAVAYPDQSVADFTIVYADLSAVASFNYTLVPFGPAYRLVQAPSFGFHPVGPYPFPFYRANQYVPEVSAAPLGQGFVMTGDNQIMRVWKAENQAFPIPDIDGGPLADVNGNQLIPRLSAGLDAPHETEAMLSNNDLSRRAFVHTDGTLYSWVDGTPQSRDDVPINPVLDQGAWIEPHNSDLAARTRYRFVEKLGNDVAGTPALITSDPVPAGGHYDDYVLMLPRTGYAMGFYPPDTLYMFRMPDRSVTVQPYLRMSQRNDGDGINRHPRLDTSHDAATSTQRGVTPRLARSNRYQ